ncbi:MAG: sigma-70 family RNA polymerase sigma factor [Chitinophagaceae bacterium]|nr:sigma-70 family RNA polymerase sigma factor [Anaerolineae bacterium]
MDSILTALSNEKELIGLALADPTSFAMLYDHYISRVYTYIRYRVDNATTADDLTSQTFENALVNLKNYRMEQAPFSSWLFGIAHNVVSRHYRTQRRHQWLSLDRFLNHVSDTPPPEDIAISNEISQRLTLAVGRLRDHERDIIALRFGAGLNNRQIAEITNLSESNVGVILYRSIKQLRVILSE